MGPTAWPHTLLQLQVVTRDKQDPTYRAVPIVHSVNTQEMEAILTSSVTPDLGKGQCSPTSPLCHPVWSAHPPSQKLLSQRCPLPIISRLHHSTRPLSLHLPVVGCP